VPDPRRDLGAGSGAVERGEDDTGGAGGVQRPTRPLPRVPGRSLGLYFRAETRFHPPGDAAMEPKTPPTVLVCDHRGAGLDVAAKGGSAGRWRLITTTSVKNSLSEIGPAGPDVVVIDPLVEGGRAELEALLGPLPADLRPAVLLVYEPTRLDAALATIEALELEPFELVQRGARGEELRLRVERLLSDRERARELDELRHRALHDDATGLLRPRAFQARLSEHYSAAERHRLDMALVLIDLDRFGAVNKRFDHTVGDRILTRVGEAIRAALRAEDVAGRIGGDEFAVVLPYTKRVDAAHVTARLLERIRAVSGRFAGAESEIDVAASIGFETFDGTDLDGVETLRAHAEVALREAKRSGGDRGVYYRALRA